MTESAVHLQPAFILQHRTYRETSLIIDVITQDFGRCSLLAKGVRKVKSKTAGLLQPFVPLALSYVGKSELKTLSAVEVSEPFVRLAGMALYCGFYVNELVSCFLHKDDPNPEVFGYYKQCLINLADSTKLETALRVFELNLMESIGYGLYFGQDQSLNPSEKYRFTVDAGLVAAEDGVFSSAALKAIVAQEFTEPSVLAEAKLLMRTVIDSHLQGKQLKSRTVINKIIKQL